MDEWKEWWKKAEPDFELSDEAKATLKSLGPALAEEMKKDLAAKEEATKKKSSKKSSGETPK
ncbi:hypothetical protein HY251_14745 [bacterium]|nr:hypothetical protein [bacterium]